MVTTRALVGARIRELRRALGFSQEQLAQQIDVPPGTISQYERGQEFPRPERLDDIAQALGVTPEAFWSTAHPGPVSALSPLAAQAAALVEHGLRTNPEQAKRAVKVLRVLLG